VRLPRSGLKLGADISQLRQNRRNDGEGAGRTTAILAKAA